VLELSRLARIGTTRVHAATRLDLEDRKDGSWLSPEPSAPADAEALLDSPVVLAVLLRCPDECPGDGREREHADGGNHYPQEGAHDGSLGFRWAAARPSGPVFRK
jgi:hypothetical protein